MAVVAHLARSIRAVVDLVYTPRCAACGATLSSQQGLCCDCWSTLEVPSHPAIGDGAAPVLAATICNDTSRKLVLAYRLGGPIALARLLAQLIALRLPDRVAGAAQTVLVPDQVAFVGGELTRLGKGEPAFDALLRPRRTPSLVGFGREARERVLSGAIRLNPALLSGHAVVLVDKVLTSGATSSACIAAIAVARPSAISVTCFARVERTAIQSLPTPILALRGARKT